jgi:hypothetical protein
LVQLSSVMILECVPGMIKKNKGKTGRTRFEIVFIDERVGTRQIWFEHPTEKWMNSKIVGAVRR